MGRIKSTWVKTMSSVLLEKYPNDFSVDFETNKKSIDKLNLASSKSVRNKLAGSVVSVAKKNKV